MREALSRSQRTKSKVKIRVVGKATGSKSMSGTKPAKKRLIKKTVKAKAAKPVKKAVKKARPPKIAAKTTKAATKKAATGKKSTKIGKKLSSASNKSRARVIPKAKKAINLQRGVKVTSGRTKGGKGKVSLVVKAAKLPPAPSEPARRQLPSAVLRAFEQAVKVFNRRQYTEAKAMFESLQPRFPNEVEILSRAQTFIQVCAQKLAQTKSLPRNADELYDRGVFALNIGDFSQARTFFEKALRLRPDEPHLLYSLAATHAQTGSHDQAIAYLSRSIQIQPRFRSQALNDSDFSGLRENKQFLALLGLTSPFERLDPRR